RRPRLFLRPAAARAAEVHRRGARRGRRAAGAGPAHGPLRLRRLRARRRRRSRGLVQGRPSLSSRLSTRLRHPAPGLGRARVRSVSMAYEGSIQTRAEALNAQLRDAHPLEILRAAMAEYGDRLALVSSFGTESAVLL